MTDAKKLLEQRNQAKKKKPNFTRADNHKKGRLGNKWRKPKGLQNKMRLHKRGYKVSIGKGYKSPAEVKGFHKSGKEPVMVDTVQALKEIKAETQIIIINAAVGDKKRNEIIKAALAANIAIANIKDPQAYSQSIEDVMKKRTDAKKKKSIEKDAKQKELEKKAKKVEEEKKKEEAEEAKLSPEEKAKREEEKKEDEKAEKEDVLIHS